MNEDTKCVHCEVLTRQRDSVQKDVDYLTGLLERVRIDRNKALVRVTELVAELNEFRTADDDYNAHAKHYAKKCAALRKELEQCKTPESPETEAERERKALIADRLGVPSGGFLGPHVLKALDELEHLRKAHSEADNSAKNMYNANVVLSKEIYSVRLELAALRERANVDPPADQVEALARVLHAAWNVKRFGVAPKWEDSTVQDAYRDEARAAIAHLNTRPEGLPTAEELLDRWAEFSVSEDTKEQFYLAALRPWLRDPVGCELDVGPIAMLKAFNAAPKGGVHRNVDDVEGMKAVLDLCRARIKPVYECKECAGLRDEVAFWKRENVASNNKMLAARAALEGE